MAARTSTRVKINRRAVDAVRLAVGDGVFEVGKAIIEATDVPDAPPYGEGLVLHGGVLAYVDGKKVAGFSTDGRQPSKPRSAKTTATTIIQAIVGWGFPMRFYNMGTIHQPARPVFSEAVQRVAPRAPGIMRQTVKYRVARLRSIGRA